MLSINNRKEVQEVLYTLSTRVVDRLPHKVNNLFLTHYPLIAAIAGIFAIAAAFLYFHNRITPIPRPPTLTEADLAKRIIGNAKKHISTKIYHREQQFSKLILNFNQLGGEISDWSKTYSEKITACHTGNTIHHLCVAILRALSPTVSNKELTEAKVDLPSPAQSLARLTHSPFSELARKYLKSKGRPDCLWDLKKQADLIEEISKEVLNFPILSRTPKSIEDEKLVMTYVDEEFWPFIQNMFDEIVAADRLTDLTNLLMKKLDLNESDRGIIEEFIKQLPEYSSGRLLLSPVHYNPFSRLRKHEELFIPSNVRQRKTLMKETLKILSDLKTQKDDISILSKECANSIKEKLGLFSSDQLTLERIAKEPSANHLAELMKILDSEGFPDYSYDPLERCPLASYLPTAQAFHTTTQSPLFQPILGDLQWVAFIEKSFQLAHRVMELQAGLAQLSSECESAFRDFENNQKMNTKPFKNRIDRITSGISRIQEALKGQYEQLSSIIPER